MKTKRLTAFVLALLLGSAVSCSPKTPPPAESASQPGPEPAVSAIAPAEPDPQPVPEEPAELPFVNPLTGEGCETDISKNRPIAVMLNNLKKALPQMGVSRADIIYEIPAEGGITRMLALFQDIGGVGTIGSVRSARDYYVSLACGHDAIYLHAGGSPQAYTAISNWGVAALDCVNGPYEGTLYWRDEQRRKTVGMEHSVVTSSEKIQELFPTYTRLRQEHKDGFDFPWTFAQEAAPSGGKQADTVTVAFSTYKTGVFQYDGDTGLYYVSEYGQPYVDGNSGEQVAVKNVLILNTDVSIIPGDSAGRLKVRTTGSGKGVFACGGKAEDITWSRASDSAPLTFLNAQGKPLELGVGTSYINIIGSTSSYTLE
ncbi:MAG: DUF3048 domain-containing protein [Lawsonibacter sp.]|nr:DUF3048 domain-containing protein [Lawsonibacter sp.]